MKVRMKETSPDQTVSRFRAVDIAIDVVILASVFLLPTKKFSDLLPLEGSDFLTELSHLPVLILGYFGVALYISRMYGATALRADKRFHHKVLFPKTSLGIFTGLVVCTIVLSIYNLFLSLSLPVFSSLFLIVESLIFGFSLGLDFEIERQKAIQPHYKDPLENTFSQSLSTIPYIVLTAVIVFPTEYLIALSDFPLIGQIITFVASCALAFFLSGLLDRIVFSKLQINARMTVPTIAIVTILMVVGFIGFDLLDAVGRTSNTFFGRSKAAEIVLLFLLGIVPVRIGNILFSGSNTLNKVVGGVTVTIYLAVEIGVIDLGLAL
jgi:hypothetical protein